MSYRVEYAGKLPKSKGKAAWGLGFQAMTGAFLLIFVLLVRSAWPEGQAVLQQWLMPEPVMEEFAQHLAEGDSFADSLSELCREAFAVAEE